MCRPIGIRRNDRVEKLNDKGVAAYAISFDSKNYEIASLGAIRCFENMLSSPKDMHPGTYFVDPTGPSHQRAVVDFWPSRTTI
jgi:hypothetical protein